MGHAAVNDALQVAKLVFCEADAALWRAKHWFETSNILMMMWTTMQRPSFADMCTSASVEPTAAAAMAAIPPISCADVLEAEGRRHEPRLNREVERGLAQLIGPCRERLGLVSVSEMVNREVVRGFSASRGHCSAPGGAKPSNVREAEGHLCQTC